jgi:ATP-binding cassette subfamily B (MDR/TAP) protein 1
MEDILRACKTGDLQQTIIDLPEGLETLVGLNGRSLSGGQQQRIAIARARLRDSPIVILGEATSALDQTSKQNVMEKIRGWREEKTIIIITHDVSQIRDDEYVYVLDDGNVVQKGYRKDLADKKHGTFASFLPVHIQRDDLMAPGQGQKPEPATPLPPFTDHPGHIHPLVFLRTPQLARFRPNSLSFLTPKSLSVSYFQDLPRRPSGVETENISLPHVEYASSVTAGRSPPISASVTDNQPSPLQISQNDAPTSIAPRPEKRQETQLASFKEILGTIWPTLSWKDRIYFSLGFFFAFIVAASTPAFAYDFAGLLGICYLQGNRVSQAKIWAVALLGITCADGLATFCMHYALERSGQAWVNSLRVETLKRILAQSRSWFGREENLPARLNECLDRSAEEVRNLVGRFTGPIFTTVLILG